MKRFVLLSVLLITACSGSLWAYNFAVNGIYYNSSSGNKATVTYQSSSYNSYSGRVTIPSSVTYSGTTYTVTAIGNSAFRNSTNLTSVSIPSTVTTIDSYAFYGCSSLATISLPNSVTSVGSYAFEGCASITSPLRNSTVFAYMPKTYTGSYTIPSGITAVARYAFCGCTGLTYVSIPNSVTDISGSDFNGCTGITQPLYNSTRFVFLPRSFSGSYTIPSAIQVITQEAFSGCSALTSVTIPNSVTTIGSHAFIYCTSLTTVTIPSSVSTLGSYPFMCCNGLTSIYFKRFTPPSDITWLLWTEDLVLYVPCGATQGYRTALRSSNDSISEWNVFQLDAQSADTRYGTASVTQQFYCSQPGIITATTTAEHYHFAKWNDDNTSNPRTITTLTSDITYLAIFEIDKHTITANAVNGSIIGGGTYDYGTSVTLTATPNAHYHFVRWNDNNTSNPRTVSVTGNKTYIAVFGIDSHTITTTHSGSGTVTGGGSYNYGSNATLTATPDAHYHFTGWTDGNTSNPRTVSVTGDKTYKANFVIDSHTITTTKSGSGTVTGGGSYYYGSNATLTATPSAHYHFVRWDDNNTSNPRTVSVTGNMTYKAIFEIDSHTISVGGTNGTVTGGGTYNYGSTATLTAIHNDHYHFVRWNDNDTSNPRTITVNGNKTYTAYFEIDKHTISATPSNGGSVNGVGIYNYGSSVTLTAIPNAHYHFIGWSDGETATSRTVNVYADYNYTAYFEIDQHTISTYASAGGRAIGGGTYDYGTSVTITAIPNDHYHFVNWSDGVTDSLRNVTILADKTYIANFEIDQHTITTDESGGGSVIGGGTYNYGTNVTVTAIPDDHYHFIYWSDGVTDSSRTITVIEEKTYTAFFDIDSHIVTAEQSDGGTVIGGGIYDYGDTVSLVAIPDAHYHFVSWTDGDTSIVRTITVIRDSSFAANFEIDRLTLTSSSANCTIDSLGTYDYGTIVTLTVLPDNHYHFVRWEDNSSTNPVRTVQVTADIDFEVEIWIDSFDIQVYSSDGRAKVTGNGRYEYNTLVTLVAYPKEGYRFVQWSDSSVYNPYIFEAVENLNISAECEAVTEVGNATDNITFYYAGDFVYNPEGEMLYLYSSDGKLITTSDADIDITALPKGIYFVSNGKGSHVKIAHIR